MFQSFSDLELSIGWFVIFMHWDPSQGNKVPVPGGLSDALHCGLTNQNDCQNNFRRSKGFLIPTFFKIVFAHKVWRFFWMLFLSCWLYSLALKESPPPSACNVFVLFSGSMLASLLALWNLCWYCISWWMPVPLNATRGLFFLQLSTRFVVCSAFGAQTRRRRHSFL